MENNIVYKFYKWNVGGMARVVIKGRFEDIIFNISWFLIVLSPWVYVGEIWFPDLFIYNWLRLIYLHPYSLMLGLVDIAILMVILGYYIKYWKSKYVGRLALVVRELELKGIVERKMLTLPFTKETVAIGSGTGLDVYKGDFIDFINRAMPDGDFTDFKFGVIYVEDVDLEALKTYLGTGGTKKLDEFVQVIKDYKQRELIIPR